MGRVIILVFISIFFAGCSGSDSGGTSGGSGNELGLEDLTYVDYSTIKDRHNWELMSGTSVVAD